MATTGGAGIDIDAEMFLNALTSLQPPRLDKAVTLALVDTAKSTISRAGSLIAKHTGLKAGMARSLMFYDRVQQGDRQVVIRSSRKAIPLINFPSTRQTKAGIVTKAWGRRTTTIRSGFITTVGRGGISSGGGGGHTGAFVRVSRARLPIKQLYGPTIAGTFATPEVQTLIATTAKERLRAALRRRIAAEQRKRR
jgi:hypothetical protein